MIEFEFEEDRLFFSELLTGVVREIDDFGFLFDFREPKIKRGEFNKNYNRVYLELKSRMSETCHLGISDQCSFDLELVVDHIIPLSSNKLNKTIRHLKAEANKKVLTQSFGSNDIRNLTFSCRKCNAEKMNGFLSIEKYLELFEGLETDKL